MARNISQCPIGSRVKLWGEFYNEDEELDDPAAPAVTIRQPGGKMKTYAYPGDAEVVKDAAGLYYIEQDMDVKGNWYFRWYSTGTGKSANEGTVKVIGARAIKGEP